MVLEISSAGCEGVRDGLEELLYPSSVPPNPRPSFRELLLGRSSSDPEARGSMSSDSSFRSIVSCDKTPSDPRVAVLSSNSLP
jgi:hypothetical protein